MESSDGQPAHSAYSNAQGGTTPSGRGTTTTGTTLSSVHQQSPTDEEPQQVQQQQQQQQKYRHRSNPRHHPQFDVGPLLHKRSTALPATESSSGIYHTLCEDEDGGAPEEAASYYEHWASPTEVLEFRALVTDLVSRQRAKTEHFRQELAQLQQERDTLTREVRDARRLNKMYATAQKEYEKGEKERSQWTEERELLRLQLQRLSVDNQRLELELQHHQQRGHRPSRRGLTTRVPAAALPPLGFPPSSESAPTGTATTSTAIGKEPSASETAATSLPTPSPLHSSLSAELNSMCTLPDCEATAEQLRLLEELHRCATARAELAARLRFSETLWDAASQRASQRCVALVAERDATAAEAQQLRDAAALAGERHAVAESQLRECRAALSDAGDRLRRGAEEWRAAAERERQRGAEALDAERWRHAAAARELRAELQAAVGAAEAARGRAERAAAERAAELREAAERAAGLEAESAAAAEAAAAERARRRDAEERAEALRLEAEAAAERAGREGERAAGLEAEAEGLRREAAAAKAECERAKAELERAKAAERADGQTAERAAAERRDAEAAIREAYAQRDAMERELEEERTHSERAARVQQNALVQLQQSRDEEVARLARDVERGRQRCRAYKVRLAAAAKGLAVAPRADAPAASRRERNEREERETREEKGPEGPDAVMLLRESAAIVATLTRTIHHTT